MKLQPIVEGHGDVQAVPVLLRRLRDEGQVFGVDVGRPIRRNRTDLIHEEGVERTVRLALLPPVPVWPPPSWLTGRSIS